MEITGKTALVTGANRGFGRHLASQLRDRGAAVYAAARNPAAPFTHELSVIGDKRIPYDLLLTVLYTAGQAELENYRFVVLQKGEPGEG